MFVVRCALPLCLALALSLGCGLLSSRHSELNGAASEISVQVESHHTSDIVIYLMNGSQAQRLGMVTGVSSASFVLPYRRLAIGGRIRLRAHPVGGKGSFTSEDVLVQPGQSIRWTLESDLTRSSLSVY